jgi:hypothetical protein
MSLGFEVIFEFLKGEGDDKREHLDSVRGGNNGEKVHRMFDKTKNNI